MRISLLPNLIVKYSTIRLSHPTSTEPIQHFKEKPGGSKADPNPPCSPCNFETFWLSAPISQLFLYYATYSVPNAHIARFHIVAGQV